jgi:magnesium transporter
MTPQAAVTNTQEDYLRSTLDDILESLEDDSESDEESVRQLHLKTALNNELSPWEARLKRIIDDLHPGDIAYILEALPVTARLKIWNLVAPDQDGPVLLEVTDAVRETLIAVMDRSELICATEQLGTDEIADLAPDLPDDVIHDVLVALNDQNRRQLESVLASDENSVAALMDFNMLTIPEDTTLRAVLRFLRIRGNLPEHTDKLFVVDEDSVLKGVLSLKRLILGNPDRLVSDVMATDVVCFQLMDDAHEVARAFERYDLVTAPVVNEKHELQGRIRVDAIVDVIRRHSDEEQLAEAGLREDEDIFSSVWKSARNRWFWLAINLITAFVSTRVIGLFEDTIVRIVALASLMPIVAGMGGNTGNQTSMMLVRSLAMGLITTNNVRRLIFKEILISILNGMLWGSILGALAYGLYRDPQLGLVMAGATLINLVVAAVMGLIIPLTRHRMGLDPAMGTSVLLTAMTDGMGFLIFLGLASVVL